VVRVKDNQPTLHAALAGLCAAGCPFDSHETVDRGRHGRQEHRRVEVFDTAGLLDAPWQALISCVARVSRLTYIKDTRTGLWATREEVGYYPCQTRHGAKILGGAIRAHWGTEKCGLPPVGWRGGIRASRCHADPDLAHCCPRFGRGSVAQA
jgi:hypothetical protein